MAQWYSNSLVMNRLGVRVPLAAYGALAQLGECVPCKDEAQGSSP